MCLLVCLFLVVYLSRGCYGRCRRDEAALRGLRFGLLDVAGNGRELSSLKKKKGVTLGYGRGAAGLSLFRRRKLLCAGSLSRIPWKMKSMRVKQRSVRRHLKPRVSF